MSQTTVFFGPPGTGKTTTLMNKLEELLESGVDIERVSFVSFTTKAVLEARNRACLKFNLDPDNIPYFKTLHALCFSQIAMSSSEVFSGNHVLDFAKKMGTPFSLGGRDLATGELTGGDLRGDRLLHLDYLSRATLRPLGEVWDEWSTQYNLSWIEVDYFSKAFKAYKETNGLVDFTDMLELFLKEDVTPDIRYLFVDEAQDLTPLQWEVVDRLRSIVKQTFVCGDDDQALFTWNGADPERLMKIHGNRIVLSQSYRIPFTVHGLAKKVSERISQRVEKHYAPRETPGFIQHINDLNHLPLDCGTWLLLVRNRVFMEPFIEHCIDNGLQFECDMSPIRKECFLAVSTHHHLMKGGFITAADLREHVVPFLPTRTRIRRGSKKALDEMEGSRVFTLNDMNKELGIFWKDSWEKLYLGFTEQERNYLLKLEEKGIQGNSPIKISTIHGAKGGEADYVCFSLDMTYRTFENYQDNPDTEHRVFYVAITRAKEGLYVMAPFSPQHYEL